MPRVVRDWEVDERGEYFCYVDTYTAQREAEGELSAARANIEMLTPYLQRLHRSRYSVKINFAKLYRRR
jgi:hypothetical protein